MAKKFSRRPRARRPVYPLVTKKSLALTNLAANDLVSDVLSDSAIDTIFGITLKATWAIANHTAAEGPIDVGIAHSDYTDAEIEEWIENQASWEQGDKIGQEVGRRKIRQVGAFRTEQVDVGLANYTLNEGREITTKCNWMLQTGQTLKIWAYNSGGSALATTNPAVRVNGHCNLWPR